MDPKIQLLTQQIESNATPSTTRSAWAPSMFPHGLGSPDGQLARGDSRFRLPQPPGVAGPIGQSYQTRGAEPARPETPSPVARLRALLVERGARVPLETVSEYDVVAIRLHGPDHLMETVHELLDATAGCSAARLIVVDDGLPVWSRRDAQPKQLRPTGVSVVEEREIVASTSYELTRAAAE